MWLESMRVLRRAIQTGFRGVNSTTDVGSESEGEEIERVAVELDWRQPCTICGRTYAHEHKQAVRASSLCDGELSD